jgi:hypothetical protein
LTTADRCTLVDGDPLPFIRIGWLSFGASLALEEAYYRHGDDVTFGAVADR